MDFVYCPNGHANRPGTRICAFCRALIEQRAPRPAAAPPPPPPPAAPSRPSASSPAEALAAAPEPAPTATTAAAPPRKKRNWLWLLLLLLLGLVGLLALAVMAFFYPGGRAEEAQPTTVVATTAAVIVVNTPELAPTDPPLPTATLEEISPPPTESADEASPTAVSTITPLSTIVGVVITPTFSFGPDTNLLQNGDFASDWANGWSSEINGESNRVEVRPLDDEPDVNALHLEQSGPGYVKIAQRIVLTYPIEGLEFQARIRAAGTAGGVAEGRGMLILQYEDFNGDPIGASIWLDGSAESTDLWDTNPMSPLAGLPVAEHTLGEGWQTLTIDLGREFSDELAEISPIDVVQLTIIVAVVNSDACGAGGCAAALDAADLFLAPNLP